MTTATTRQLIVEDEQRYWPSKEGRRAPEEQMLNQFLIYLRNDVVAAIVYFRASSNGIADDGTGLEVVQAYYLNGEAHPEYFDGLTVFDLADYWHEHRLYPLWVTGVAGQVWRVADFRDDRSGRFYIFATSQDAEESAATLEVGTVYAASMNGDDSVPSFDELVTLSEGSEVKRFNYAGDGWTFASWDEFYEAGNRVCIEDYSLPRT